MSVFKRSILQSFKGAVETIQTFPVVIASALAFTIVTMIRIQLDWPQQETYNFIFTCLHLSFASGAIFGLAAITAVQSRYNHVKAFLIANLLGIVVVIITFVSLYVFGGIEPAIGNAIYISSLAASRIASVITVSFIAFIFFAGHPKEQSDFARALFMIQKAFIIASIYGAVIMSGTSGVVGAIQSLLYRDMSSKVYMYLGALTGFLAFTIFVGYFPDFRKGHVDERREVAQKQPRFIEILFEYIMIPIVLALTGVLLIWAGKSVVTGSWPAFTKISGIVISYVMGGIWLHLMVTRLESGLAQLYRRIYPVTALVILIFGLWAFLIRLGESGLKTQEYFFALIWIVAVAAAILLLVMKVRAHSIIAALVCALVIFSVLPAVGHHALPVSAQINRLEDLLISQGMLENDQLIPAMTEPTLDVRESITDAVDYLAYEEEAKLPSWFDEDLGDSDVFKNKLGFEQAWPEREYIYDEEYEDVMGIFLTLPNGTIDIGEYSWVVHLQDYEDDGSGKTSVTIDGENGLYSISWTTNFKNGIPTLKILLNDDVILEQSLKDYLDEISETFQSGKTRSSQVTTEDMSLVLENEDVAVLLVFDHIEVNVDPRRDEINYWLKLTALYLKEKH